MNNCLKCEKQIEKWKKYCSKKCYSDSRIGLKRPEHSEKVKRALLGVKHTKERITNLKNTLHAKWEYTEEELNKVRYIIETEKHVTSGKPLCEKAGVKYKYRVIDRFRLENKDLFKDSIPSLNLKIQNLSISEFEQFKKDYLILEPQEMSKKYNLTMYELKCNATRLNLKLPTESKYNRLYLTTKKPGTYIENLVEDYLLEHNVNYIRQVYKAPYIHPKLNKRAYKFIYDLEVKDLNLLIEIHGDYWHANPLIVDYSKLFPVQIDNIANDKIKEQWAKDNGYDLYVIWERDLYINRKQTLENLLNYIREKQKDIK